MFGCSSLAPRPRSSKVLAVTTLRARFIGASEQSTKDQYINETFAREDEYLSRIREALRQDGKEGINISPGEGKLLGLWVRAIQARTVVEIGTLYGYSTLWIARFLPSDGKIISLEKSPEHYEKAKELLQPSPYWERIDLRCGPALSVLPELRGTYDMVFIDADKSGYLDYLDWAEEHIRPGGLIIGDNTLLFGHMMGEGERQVSRRQVNVMREFNKRLSNAELYESVMVPTHEGMTVAVKK